MIRTESNNSFGEGLMMDMNPMTTPNTVMTNCLNGTLITFNGNEYILLNDMGNGRVETAYLPEGFIPLGTTELGGIIYIVSYNPINNRCQIGSFPSPERNITSDEGDPSPTVILSDNDFGWNGQSKGASVYYVKKNLNSNLIFNPGDKFIVYGDNISNNNVKIQFEDLQKNNTIRLYLGTITSDGKLVVFDNSELKKFNLYNQDNEFINKSIIYQYKLKEDGKTVDLDDYRSLTSQPYNIFNSKISGELVVIAELIQFDTFNVEITNTFSDNKEYDLNIVFKFEGESEFVPYGVICKYSLSNGETDTLYYKHNYENEKGTNYNNFSKILNKNYYEFNVTDGLSDTNIKKWLDTKYNFNNSERESLILSYEFIPCMNWGPVNYLAIKGTIDLSKLGSGIIDLTSWRYYNTDSKCSLTWGLDVYEEEGCNVSNVKFNLSRYISNNETETITYQINKKTSYHGTFYDVIPLDIDTYKITSDSGSKYLASNSLYLVEIIVTYDRPKPQQAEERKFYRWLYTNSIFNDKYYTESDFNNLIPNFDQLIISAYKSDISLTSSTSKYGIICQEVSESDSANSEALNSESSLSACQTVKSVITNCSVKVSLKNDYNSFVLGDSDVKLDFNRDNDNDIQADISVSSSLKYTDSEDTNYQSYLQDRKLNKNKDEDGNLKIYDISEATSDELINGYGAYGYGIWVDTKNISPYNYSNTYTFNINSTLIELTKAYCTKKLKELSYTGYMKPLCSTPNDFSDYNLKWKEDYQLYIPSIMAYYSSYEPKGKKGELNIGTFTEEELPNVNEEWVKREELLSINFGTDDMVELERLSGWTNSAIFAAHYGAKTIVPCITFGGTAKYNENYIGDYDPNKEVDSTVKIYSYLSIDGKCNPVNYPNDEFPKEIYESFPNFVMLMMLSNDNDNRYYPVNFSFNTFITGGDRQIYFTPSSDTFEGFYKLYLTFAQILNNIYKYSSESFITNYIIPAGIYYGDNYKYEVKIPVNVDSKSNEIKIKLQDGSFKSLSDYKNIIGSNESVISNNLDANINDLSESFNIIILDTNNTGRTLRDYISGKADINLGTAIYDFDGKTLLSHQIDNFKTSELYCRDITIKTENEERIATVLNTVSRASSFLPVNIDYDNKTGNAIVWVDKTSKHIPLYPEHSPKQNLSSEFTLSDSGLLVIKTPNKIGKTLLLSAIQKQGDRKNKYITGLLTIGFSDSFKAWK